MGATLDEQIAGYSVERRKRAIELAEKLLDQQDQYLGRDPGSWRGTTIGEDLLDQPVEPSAPTASMASVELLVEDEPPRSLSGDQVIAAVRTDHLHATAAYGGDVVKTGQIPK